jgi:hypothetical protein
MFTPRDRDAVSTTPVQSCVRISRTRIDASLARREAASRPSKLRWCPHPTAGQVFAPVLQIPGVGHSDHDVRHPLELDWLEMIQATELSRTDRFKTDSA